MNPMESRQAGAERFGLFGFIESRRVSLPLKGVEAEFTARGGMVEVVVNQIFRQENPAALDCEFLFPLPADAAVFACEAEINTRVIQAMVKERNEARQIASSKKAAGFRTALVESERDNLFTLSLGNVQPEDLVIVRLRYIQNLRAVGEMRSLEIPLCPGVRFIPGRPLLRDNRGKGVVDDTDEVPDASRITPPRIESQHPDAAYLDIRGTIDLGAVEQASVNSPSHRLTIQDCDGDLLVTLADKGQAPDQDFALRWRERRTESLIPRAWTTVSEGNTHALLEIRAPRDAVAQSTAIDYYILVDRSGSMAGAKWTKALDALRSCLTVLGADDRVMITFFASDFQDFAEQPLPVMQLAESAGLQNLKRLKAGGGTQMAPALRHVLEVAAKCSQGRDKNLILITDACIGNESAILDLMRQAPGMATHCFGIDVVLNDSLLLALTRQQGGTFHSLHPDDDIEAAVTALAAMLRQPVLLDLELPGWDCAEARIPNLYAGQIIYVSARATGEQPLELTARTASGEATRLVFAPQKVGGRGPELQWRRGRLRRLLAEGRNHEAIALSVSSNLLCGLTAFVAWDEAEKVAVARHELVQPALQPRFAGNFSCLERSGLIDAASATEIAGLCERRFLLESREHGMMADRAPLADIPPQSVVRRELDDVCGRLEAAGCPALRSMASGWFDRLMSHEFMAQFSAVRQLTRKLDAYVRLLEVLGDKNATEDQLRLGIEICRATLVPIRARWNTDRISFDDLPDLLQRAEALVRAPEAARTTPREALLQDLRQRAVQAARLFFEQTPAPLAAAP